MKIIAHKFRKNVAIIFAGAICALVIFYVIKNPNLFQTSILLLEEKAFMNEKKRDVAYKTNQWPFEVFIAEKHKHNTETFEWRIYFDPNEVEILIDQWTWQGILQKSTQNIWNIDIKIGIPKSIDTNKEIIWIPFSGNGEKILLGESRITTKKTKTSLSVGNLDEFIRHSK